MQSQSQTGQLYEAALEGRRMGREACCMRRTASARQCRHPVVNDDHGTTRDVGRLGGTVGALAAFELGELRIEGRSELAYHERRQTTGDTYVERASE